jgi:hypothetical protein
LLGAGGSFSGSEGIGAWGWTLPSGFELKNEVPCIAAATVCLYGVYRSRFTHACRQKSLPLPGIQPNRPLHNPTTCSNSMGNVGNNVQCSRFYVAIYSFLSAK